MGGERGGWWGPATGAAAVSAGASVFWQAATAVPCDGGFAVALDGRLVKTPAHTLLAVPTQALAEVIAAGIPGDRLGIHCHDDTGNAVATVVVARWEGALDRDQLAAALDGKPLPVAAAPDPAAGPGDRNVLALD